MPTVGGNVLRQQFSVELNEEEMRIKLKQTLPGDARLETYAYTNISGGTVEARNSAGLTATFSFNTSELEMKMNGAGPRITGKCLPAEKCGRNEQKHRARCFHAAFSGMTGCLA